MQEAAAIGGFVFRTHQGYEAAQGNAKKRLMAIQVCRNWVRFTIFNFFRSPIRPDFARMPAARSRRTRGIDQHSALSTQHSLPTMEFHRLARRGWPYTDKQAS